MKGILLDRKNNTLYVEGIVAVIDGESTPQYVTYLSCKLSAVNAQIEKCCEEKKLLEWAITHPSEWPAESISRFEGYLREIRQRLPLLHALKRSLLNGISFSTLNTLLPMLDS